MLEDKSFISQHRLVKTAFSRVRTLPFKLLVLFLANLRFSSTQTEANRLFQVINNTDLPEQKISRSAICQARQKLSHKVFISLLHFICKRFNEHPNIKLHNGLRVFAVDGSTCTIPNNEGLREVFGEVKFSKTGARACSRISFLEDVLNRVTYDAILGHYTDSEREMAIQHLKNAPIPENSLILMDRGYIDYKFFQEIIDLGFHFCGRIKMNLSCVKHMIKKDLYDYTTEYRPANYKGAPIKVRVIRISLIKGDDLFLMTTLLDSKVHKYKDFWGLYHMRWQIEESIKVKKCRMTLNGFTSTAPEILRQDFHAKIFTEALTSILTASLSTDIKRASRKRTYKQQVSMTKALSIMKSTLVNLFLGFDLEKFLYSLGNLFMKSLESIVPGRSYVRDKTDRRRTCSISQPYQSI